MTKRMVDLSCMGIAQYISEVHLPMIRNAFAPEGQVGKSEEGLYSCSDYMPETSVSIGEGCFWKSKASVQY